VHHVTFLTEDIERLTAFYERVFEARRTLDMTEEGVRHVFLEAPRPSSTRSQILDGPPLPPAPGTMFHRGRLAQLSRRRTPPEGDGRRAPDFEG
jgi:catechol 2,3-dioxygenase-like lactoylglutathione lyase family enzyme